MVTLRIKHSITTESNHTNSLTNTNKINGGNKKKRMINVGIQKSKPDAKATTDANNAGTNIAASEVGLGAGASTVAAAACPTAEKATAMTMKTTIIFIDSIASFLMCEERRFCYCVFCVCCDDNRCRDGIVYLYNNCE